MPAEAAINAELSNFGVYLFFDNMGLIANRIAKVIPVNKNPGEYHVLLPIEGKNVHHDTKIPHGGVATEINFALGKGMYSTEEYGKRHPVTDREMAMSAQAVLEYRKGIEMIIEELALDRESKVAEILLTEASYYVSADDPHWFDAADPWDTDDSDPLHDIKAARRAIKIHSGRDANTMILSPKAEDALIDNSHVQDIFKTQYGLRFIQTAELPNPLFGLRVIQAGAVYDENPRLESSSLKFLWESIGEAGDDWCWVGYVDPSPGLKTSAMILQFAFNNNVLNDRDILTVREYYEEATMTTWYEGRTDYEVKLSNGRAGAIIKNITSEAT